MEPDPLPERKRVDKMPWAEFRGESRKLQGQLVAQLDLIPFHIRALLS